MSKSVTGLVLIDLGQSVTGLVLIDLGQSVTRAGSD